MPEAAGEGWAVRIFAVTFSSAAAELLTKPSCTEWLHQFSKSAAVCFDCQYSRRMQIFGFSGVSVNAAMMLCADLLL